MRKTPKRTLANKFGKSLSNFKSNMTKVLHPGFSSNEALQQLNANDISSPLEIRPYDKQNNVDSKSLATCIKSLQDENRLLKELVNRKEAQIIHLTKSSNEERLKYEIENLQLKRTIQQLQIENSQLKAHESYA